ncbi:disease resistance protein At4g27190-like [Morus notabilis]|uniref:disease resistance protein At4g27190-like n=1 Tax=Morus notabilis TaxID=981085 RepID=UPI000CED0593|nr:disease resistance protein At4g27190-like [Morus notabilis]
MEFLIACGASIVAKFVEYTTVLSARRLFDYGRNVNNLRGRIQELNDAEETIRGRVEEATRIGEEIHADVQSWLSSTRSISQRAEDFLNNNRDRANFSCCNVRIPNLASRRQLSREARQMVEDVTHQIQAAEFIRISSRPALHSCIAFRGEYEYFESRKRMLEEIMKALQDREVTKIGVYGMGGIGKTMLAKEVARQATEAKLFTEVAMTTISQTPDPRRFQQEIAEKINLDIKEVESVPARADRLQRRLREEKRILIILDDIWEILDLLEVGIPFEHHGCKILMTSRSLDVVRSMGVEKSFQVYSIFGEEAMNLFQGIVGDIVERPDFKRLAIDVVGECGGLPLAITTVASTLKGQDSLDVWRDTLRRLRNIISPTNIDEPLREVYRSIRLSYDSLSDEQKSLLLLCSLHGEDSNIRIQDLIMIGVGWGLFHNVHTLSDARTRVHSLVVRLKARCLLLDGYGFDCVAVRMHDVIRDVALSIASEERDMHSIVIDKLEDCLNGKNLKDSKVISLRYESSDTQLPERLDCPQLESLFLVSDAFGRMERRMPIPKHFFEKSRHHLKSLLFCEAELVPIPPSLHSLQNLQTLCLRYCVLGDVKLIGDLTCLIILDLSYSTIKQLPIEVGQLNRLQLLNLEGCNALELIEPNVISSLIRLEELHIPYSFDKWEAGEITVCRRSNANLAELVNLPQLTSLSLRVPHSKTFPKHFMFSEELERYRICIGSSMHSFWDPRLYGVARSLELTLQERSQLKELGLESLVKRSEALSLDGLVGVKNVVCDLDNEGFSDLKRLEFSRNVSVQYIVNCTVDQQIHLRKAFPMLETLRLGKLTNLERICQGKLPQDSFNKLREVYVTNCDKLKNLFPLSIAKRLEYIQVRDCDMMEEVVGHGRENDAHIISDEATHHVVEFLELHSLILQSLPKFVQFISWSESEATCGSSSVQSPIPLFCEKIL